MTVAVAMANKSKNKNKNGHKSDAQRRTLHTLPNSRTVNSEYPRTSGKGRHCTYSAIHFFGTIDVY